MTSNIGRDRPRPTLGVIRAVTYSVPDLRAIEQAYVGELGYTVAARPLIDRAEADAWGAPTMAGSQALLLAPASAEAVHLRFIHDADAAGWEALTTFGWNATEFVVQDVEALATRLAGGAFFRVIGPPRPLTRFPMIRAMQALGPAGECCYFTQVGAGSGLELAAARAFVGRVFIVVSGGPDVNRLLAAYAAFANPRDPPVATPVSVISRFHGLPSGTMHRHALVRLTEGTLIELDEYPRSARVRPIVEGKLAPGMAMVTLSVDSSVEHFASERALIAPPAACRLPGITGTCGCIRGAAGELIELVGPA